MMKRLSAMAAAAALVGCGSGIPEPKPVVQRAALESFSGPNACADLERYIEDTAVLDMKTQLEAMKTGEGGWWGRGGIEDMAAGAPTAAETSKAQGPSSYTTTNTQVAGVDEADFVKNDGTRIFVLSGDTLYINQSWPAPSLGTVSKLKIEGYPQEMFLDEKNHVVVFSAVYTAYPFDARGGGGGGDGADRACDAWTCGHYSSNTVKVTVVDVGDLAQPKVASEYYLPGQYSSSRRVGGSVRLVLSDQFHWPRDVRFWPDYTPGLWEDKARLGRAFDDLIAKNEKLIRAATLEQWLPPSKARLGGQETTLQYDCTDFYKPNAPTRLGMVNVATVNLDSSSLDQSTIIAESGEVYASAKSLYVANRHWWWWPQPGQSDATYLHKFDITQPDAAVYVASGKVDGHIVDQFSMDEDAKGFFRVATTIATRVADKDNRWGRLETVNRVSVLNEQSGQLEVIGRTEDLAKGERVTASRFVGDKAFLVTFRQVDPLFTIDLSDPAAPRKIGELKIPGFSTYLHPLDKDHLLTIGTYVDENNQWQTRRLQLSIFDVSDLANPKQTFTQAVGSAYGWSEAQGEHKAFNYFPAKKLLAIPFWDYNPRANGPDAYWMGFVTDLRVFKVDAGSGIQPVGSISMKDLYMTFNDYGWTWYWTPAVRRSVMADDYVYAISDAGIRVANVADLGKPVATVRFGKATGRQ